MEPLVSFFLTLFGLAGSAASLAPYYIKLKSKLNKLAVHEQILFGCFTQAVKEITGKDPNEFHLKEEVEVFERAINFFEHQNITEDEGKTRESILGNEKDLILIENRFVELLKDKADLSLLIHIVIESFEDSKEILKRTINIESKINQINESMGEFPQKITEQLTRKYLDKSQKFVSNYIFQEAPTIHDGFIGRSSKILELHNLLKQKPVVFIHGMTRSSKSILVSQYIHEYPKDNYYWYDFKLTPPNNIQLFYNDLANFLAAKFNDSEIVERWKTNQLSVKEIINYLLKICDDLNGYVLVLDNIHLINEIQQIDAFIKSLLESNSETLKIILISENRDVIDTATTTCMYCTKYELRGFDDQEILELFKLNEINCSKISKDLVSLVRISTEGHPDIINGLIASIKRNAQTRSTVSEIITNMLDGWKSIPETSLLIQSLAGSIKSNLLTTEEELKLFSRLSALIGKFSEDLALHISQVPPVIESFGIRFRKIRNNLLDNEPGNRFRIPSIYKKAGEDYITAEEKKKICHSAAIYLMTPKNRVINFDDGVEACFYFLSGDDFNGAFQTCIKLIVNALDKFGNNNNLKIVLDRLGFMLELNTKTEYYNDYVNLCIVYLQGYRILKKIDEQTKIVNKLSPIINHPSVNPITRYLANSYLISFYSYENLQINDVIRLLTDQHELEKTKLIPQEVIASCKHESLFLLPFYEFGIKDNPEINDLITLLNIYKNTNPLVLNELNNKDIVDFFEILWTGLYKNINESNNRHETLIGHIEKLKKLLSFFEQNKIHIAHRETLYLIGLLKIDFMEFPTEAINDFNKAEEIQKNISGLDKSFLSKNYLGKADAFFKCKQHSEAKQNYLFALDNYENKQINEQLMLHAKTRIAICLFYEGEQDDAENQFRESIKFANSMTRNRKDNLIYTLGDFSTFYVLIGNYKKAIKYLSIMSTILNGTSILPIHQLISQSAIWIGKKNKNEPIEIIANEINTFIEPYFGMYNKKFNYISDKATIFTFNLVLGMSFLAVNENKRSLGIFRKIIKSQHSNSIDISAQYLAVHELITVELSLMKYNFLIEDICRGISIFKENLDRGIKSPNSNTTLTEIINYDILNPLQKHFSKEFINKGDFILAEKFLLNLVKISNDFDDEYKTYFKASLFSSIGWFYFHNKRFDSDYLRISKNWILESNALCFQVDLTYTYINNQLLFLFALSSEIYDIKKYIIEVFTTFAIIIDHWEMSQTFAEEFFKQLFYLLNGIKTPQNITISEKNVITSLKDFQKSHDKDNFDLLSQSLLFALLIVKLRNDIVLNESDQNRVLSFIIKNFSSKITNHIQEFVEGYCAIRKRQILKTVSNEKKQRNLANQIKQELSDLRKRIHDFSSIEIIQQIDDFERELITI
ncbi:MAG: hypothetical protein WC879_12690 [Melioribacteraceae bacterium]